MNAQYQWQEIVPFKLENVNFMIYPEKRVLRTLKNFNSLFDPNGRGDLIDSGRYG